MDGEKSRPSQFAHQVEKFVKEFESTKKLELAKQLESKKRIELARLETLKQVYESYCDHWAVIRGENSRANK